VFNVTKIDNAEPALAEYLLDSKPANLSWLVASAVRTVAISLPSGLARAEATIGGYSHAITLPPGLVPVEATIGSYKA
jgi:hypothetical protein